MLTVAGGGAKNGTAIVLEKYSGQPWQLWTLTKLDNGSHTVVPKHAPALGPDHLGSQPYPGAKIDLWTCKANDRHLQWFIKPLAGSGVAPAPAVGDVPVYHRKRRKTELGWRGVAHQRR